MNKIVYGLVIYTILFGSSYNGSTKATVVLSGAVVKAQASPINTKYKRKDCPVCKGSGWYWSGDGIKKVDCGYCEPDKKTNIFIPQNNKSILVVPQCHGNDCKVKNY